MKFTVSVLTPQAEIYSGEADEIIAPSLNGEIGILPNHISLLTQISPGELKIKTGEKIHSIVIMSGYLEVANNKVTILGDQAIRAENIEIAKAEQAKIKAEKAKQEKLSQEDLALIETDLRRSILELKVANRRRRTR